MANFRPIILTTTGVSQRQQDADTLVTGSGVTTAAGNLTISAASAISIDVNKNFSIAAGTTAVDLSGGTGLFKTTTGAVTVGPGAVTVSGITTFTGAGTALTVTNIASVGSALLTPTIDSTGATNLSLGNATATSVTVGRSGQGLLVSSSNTMTTQSPLIFGVNNGATVTAGTSAFDFSGGTGIFKTSTGAVTVGPGAVTVSGVSTFSAAGTALTVTNNATISGILTVPTIDFPTTIAIGAITATSVTIGRSGQTTTVAGNLIVNGTETIVGTTIFDAGTTIGDGIGVDTLDFNSVSGFLGSVANPDVKWLKEVAHQFYVDASTTVSTVGGNLTIRSGAASAGAGATAGANGGLSTVTAGVGGAGGTSGNGGTGGNTTIGAGTGGVAGSTTGVGGTGGTLAISSGIGGAAAAGTGAAGVGGAINLAGAAGGAGSATGAAGVGGQLNLLAGAAGANGGGGGANGGIMVIRAGAASGAGTNGNIFLGDVNTSSILIGSSTSNTSITGALQQQTGSVNLSANTASSFTTSAGALTLTSAAAATWSTGAGALSLSGFSILNLQSNGTTALQVASGTSVVVQAGATLSTTGSGNINLPNNGSARFNIEGVAVSANVISANLGTLTAGPASNADSLHTHVFGGANGQLSVSGLTTAAFTPVTDNGLGAYISSNSTISKTNATAIATARFFGVYEGTAGSAVIQGMVSDAVFIGSLTLTAGQPVYLSTTAGKFTNDVSAFVTGNVVQQVGILVDALTYNGTSIFLAKILIQPKSPIVL